MIFEFTRHKIKFIIIYAYILLNNKSNIKGSYYTVQCIVGIAFLIKLYYSISYLSKFKDF